MLKLISCTGVTQSRSTYCTIVLLLIDKITESSRRLGIVLGILEIPCSSFSHFLLSISPGKASAPPMYSNPKDTPFWKRPGGCVNAWDFEFTRNCKKAFISIH